MDFWQVLHSRHAVRDFALGRDVPAPLVADLLRAAIEAPSAGNLQSWHFYVVRRPAVRAALAEAALGQSFVAEAPVVIVVCADPERSATRYRERGRRLYAYLDAAAATENLLLAATALGLGTCWVSAFDEEAARQAIGAPQWLVPVAIVPVGYPAVPRPRETERRPLEEVTTYVE